MGGIVADARASCRQSAAASGTRAASATVSQPVRISPFAYAKTWMAGMRTLGPHCLSPHWLTPCRRERGPRDRPLRDRDHLVHEVRDRPGIDSTVSLAS